MFRTINIFSMKWKSFCCTNNKTMILAFDNSGVNGAFYHAYVFCTISDFTKKDTVRLAYNNFVEFRVQ